MHPPCARAVETLGEGDSTNGRMTEFRKNAPLAAERPAWYTHSMDDVRGALAANLAELRKEENLTQAEFAAQFNYSDKAVSKWERGESSPDLDNLMALAALYGCSLDQLVHADSGTAVQDGGAEAAGPKEAETAELPAGSDPLLPHGSFYDQPRFRKDFPCSLVVVVSYLVLGFFFNLWHPGWILFLTIPLYYLPDSERGYLRLLGNPVMVTIIYLLLGVYCNLWHPGWLIFLLVPLLNHFTSGERA